MTAVIHPLPRNGWSNSQGDLNNMSADDVSRIFVPRKSALRSPSSSSVSSSTSSTSTISQASGQPNGVVNGDANWAPRKKPARGLWPSSSKAEPVAGVSTARSQSVPANPSGSSAASAISALHAPSTYNSSQQAVHAPTQSNGATRNQSHSEPQAMLNLQPLNGTFERKAIVVPFGPELLRIGRQTNNKTLPTPLNGYFDSKVLSRQHAEIWADRDGKIWIRDVKSSNGTFVNGKRLSQENRDSEPHTLKEADVLELGIDIVSEDQKTVVHHKVAARVDFAGLYTQPTGGAESYEDDISAGLNGVSGQLNNQNGRGRPASQGSNGSNGRFSGAASTAASIPAAAYHAKWLQPVTMEQIVKKLNNELKQARGEASSLQNLSTYVGSVVASEIPPPAQQVQKPILSPTKSLDNIKARFASSPPAPPPSQPLPEAPSEGVLRDKLIDLPSFIPSLRRSDTEKPRALQPSPVIDNSSPTKVEQSSQILSLVEALSTAQKEIATQGERLKEMEAELNREREERRSAEERAVKLEAGATLAQPVTSENEAPISPLAGAIEDEYVPETSNLRERIDLMRAEMDNMRLQMEKYRQRASNAEEESNRDRKTLAEMVESIRKREDAARRKVERKRLSNTYAANFDSTQSTLEEDQEIEKLDEAIHQELVKTEERLRESAAVGKETHMQNGNAWKPRMSVEELQQLGKAAIAAAMSPQADGQTSEGLEKRDLKSDPAASAMASTRLSRRQEQLAQTAPYASMLGVVLLGVGLMAYLNGWQKVAER